MTGLQFSSVWENIGLSSLQGTLALLDGTTGYHNDVLTIKSRFQSSGTGSEFSFPFVYGSHQIQLLVRQRGQRYYCARELVVPRVLQLAAHQQTQK